MRLQEKDQNFRADIEALRGLAVLLVVGFHYGLPFLAGGFIGVDVFFVISGYVITASLLREHALTGAIDLPAFYGRRARRLLPALLAMLVATLVAAYFIVSPLELQHASQGAVSASGYFSNFWFMTRTFDYFAPENAENPFLHTWSLSVEEQLYLVWPAALMLAARLRGKGSTRLLIACAALASFAVCVWLTGLRQPWAFYLPFTRVWEFAAGALALGVSRKLPSRVAATASAVGLIVLGAAASLFSEATAFPGWAALAPVLAAAAILVAGRFPNAVSRVFSHALGPLGRLSYSIYLWHWPVIVLVSIRYGATTRVRIFGTLLTVALASASYYLLEQPVRGSAWLTLRRRRSLALGAAITVAGLLSATLASAVGSASADTPAQALYAEAAHLSPTLLENNPAGCLVWLPEDRPVRCTFFSGPRQIALVGDSHAAQWFTPVEIFARKHELQLTTYLKSSCSIADIPVYNMRLRRDFRECGTWRRRVFDELVATHPSIIVVSEHMHGYVKGQAPPSPTQKASVDEWAAGLQRSLKVLAQTGAQVFVIADTPLMRINVPTCLSRADLHPGAGSCSQPRELAVNQKALAREAMVVKAAGATYVNFTDQFCGPATCEPMSGPLVLYRDGNHMTDRFAASLSSRLADALGGVAPQRTDP